MGKGDDYRGGQRISAVSLAHVLTAGTFSCSGGAWRASVGRNPCREFGTVVEMETNG